MKLEKTKKILFVCHGNICRSPMAEFIFRAMAAAAGRHYCCASAAVSTEELGNGVYPPARRLLAARGIDCSGKYAVQMTAADYRRYDLLIGMDRGNLNRMRQICGGDPDGKIRLLLDFAGEHREVDDPWYSGDFTAALADIELGCQALLEQLEEMENE